MKHDKHLSLGAPLADILGLPADVDRGAMFAARISLRRNSRFLPEVKLWLPGRECAYCNAPAEEAHHLFPFWLFPSLEMDKRFWLPVCRSGQDHHLHLAHLGNFELFDPLAAEHAAIFKASHRLCTMFVSFAKRAEHSVKARRELLDALRELAAVA